MDKRVAEDIKNALALIEKGDPVAAEKVLNSGYMYNLQSNEVDVTELYCRYWIDRITNLSLLGEEEKGERLFIEWKNFLKYAFNRPMRFDDAIAACKRGVFTLALGFFNTLNEAFTQLNPPVQNQPAQSVDNAPTHANILYKLAICNKELGNYEVASAMLIESNSLVPQNSATIAALADCYALCGDDRHAKVMFREAFYIDASKVDTDFLDSFLIRSLVDQVAQFGYKGTVLNAWIPVYGVLLGIFNIKRKLSSKEIGKLRQEIYALENEQKDPSRCTPESVPRLINLYFRLIDYYNERQNENRDTRKISETLLKIKILDNDVYTQYIG